MKHISEYTKEIMARFERPKPVESAELKERKRRAHSIGMGDLKSILKR